MSGKVRLPVVLCWHMHQPQYRDLITGEYHLSWTYLHAIKDYIDMAAHLEAVPAARAVVNFAPILLDQIDDYARQVQAHMADGTPIRDALLAGLAAPVLPIDLEHRAALLASCLRANEERLIRRFPAYQRLAGLAIWIGEHPDILPYVSDQFLGDMLVWYHLAWIGETVRRTDTRVRRLMDKGAYFSIEDRRELLALIGELLGQVIGRYARLADRGQVELSVTPFAHPIVPLLLDFNAARDAMPNVNLPPLAGYPGGPERARWHVERGLATFERHFGRRPAGCWPSEGGVSLAALRLLGEAGFRWVATGEGVLRNTLHQAKLPTGENKEDWLFRPYGIGDSGVSCFFRDDGLSDLIGFTYATWHADDAVANLIEHLGRIAERTAGATDRVVTIILDGENAWEHYPENGYYFLSALYRKLAEHPRLQLTTFSEFLASQPVKPLANLAAGSWVYGTFSTWIGDKDKNRGWEMLVAAKEAFDAAAPRLDPARRELATQQLAVCEGSDWFWWFGDYNPKATVSDFEKLYRRHLCNLYHLLEVEPPEYLLQVFTRGGGAPVHGGAMRPGSAADRGG
jgi:alpha-amylase/alpha-mannosidase (GH57 family)